MEVVGEFLGIDTDKGIHGYFKRHWAELFPRIPDRSAFLRQSANLWSYKQQLHQNPFYFWSVFGIDFRVVSILRYGNMKQNLIEDFS